MNKITVQGKNEMDTQIRHKALSTLNGMPTIVLQRLERLTRSEKAVSYLKNPIKFKMIAKLIGL